MGIDKARFGALLYSVVFLSRRMLYALASAFIGTFDGGLTLVMVSLISLAYHVYICKVRPQEDINANKVELTSEVLLLYSIFGLMVCELEENPVNRYGVGWFSVSLIVSLVTLQVVYMVWDPISLIIKKIKMRIRINRHLHMMELQAEAFKQRAKDLAI